MLSRSVVPALLVACVSIKLGFPSRPGRIGRERSAGGMPMSEALTCDCCEGEDADGSLLLMGICVLGIDR